MSTRLWRTQVSPLRQSAFTRNVRHLYRPMYSDPNPPSTLSNFQALLDAALANYSKQTGRDLRTHPLAHIIDGCGSPDSIMEIFQEQSLVFHEFRKGDSELVKRLASVVNGLHAILNTAALGASLVSPTLFRILLPYFHTYL